MEIRYQVFISSTYDDLKEERMEVSKCLLDNKCIPVGMEQFPASNMSQWEYITKMIDQSDYCILILAGRYGSIEEQSGIGYTEKEYNYALEHNIPVLAFLYKDIDELPSKLIDDKEKIVTFRKKVMDSNKLAKFYTSKDNLIAEVATSINQAIREIPAVGWVRADKIYTENLKSYDETKKKFETIEKKLESLPNFTYGKTLPSGGKSGDIHFIID